MTFIYSFINSFVHSFVRLFIYSYETISLLLEIYIYMFSKLGF